MNKLWFSRNRSGKFSRLVISFMSDLVNPCVWFLLEYVVCMCVSPWLIRHKFLRQIFEVSTCRKRLKAKATNFITKKILSRKTMTEYRWKNLYLGDIFCWLRRIGCKNKFIKEILIFTITRIERKTRIIFHKIKDIGQKIITLIYKFVSRFLAYKKLIKSRKNENSMCYLFWPTYYSSPYFFSHFFDFFTKLCLENLEIFPWTIA